jgi:hypothetical protein
MVLPSIPHRTHDLCLALDSPINLPPPDRPLLLRCCAAPLPGFLFASLSVFLCCASHSFAMPSSSPSAAMAPLSWRQRHHTLLQALLSRGPLAEPDFHMLFARCLRQGPRYLSVPRCLQLSPLYSSSLSSPSLRICSME